MRQRPTEVEDPVINMSPAGRHLGESDVTNLGNAARSVGRGRTAGVVVRTVVEQRMGPEEALGKGNGGLHAWRQVGTNQRQIRPSSPGESEITGTKRPMTNPGGRELLEVWKFGAPSNLHVYNKTDTQGSSE